VQLKNITSILFALTFFLSGCSKAIKGKIQDNFGRPVSNVQVKVRDSDFSARTDDAGEFSLEYVPGKINIDFSKDGYQSEHRMLDIAEKSNYPLGAVVMIMLPDKPGLFIKSSNGYQSLKSFRLPKTTRYQETMLGTFSVSNYLLPGDSLQEVNVQTDSLEIYQYKINFVYLLSPDANNILMVEDILAPVPKVWVNDFPNAVSDDLVVRKIPKSTVRSYAYAAGIRKSRIGVVSLDRFRGTAYGFKW